MGDCAAFTHAIKQLFGLLSPGLVAKRCGEIIGEAV